MYRTDFWTLWEKARVGCFKRTASKHVYYLGWNRSPAQVGCMRQALGPGALGRPRGIGWRGRWERGSGWGTHVNPWLFHFNVWQNSLQIKKKEKKKKRKWGNSYKVPRTVPEIVKRLKCWLSSLSLTGILSPNLVSLYLCFYIWFHRLKSGFPCSSSRWPGTFC